MPGTKTHKDLIAVSFSMLKQH
ncbi:hypothetical protein ACHAXS_003456 [Conticribra weissflogii]